MGVVSHEIQTQMFFKRNKPEITYFKAFMLYIDYRCREVK